MRKLGILGGMSWESSAIYYRLLNEGVRARLGGLSSAKLVLSSLDFALIARLQAQGHWDEAGRLLAQEARALEAAGAEAILLATNTMHKLAPQITAAIRVPFLHIADALAAAIKPTDARKPLLLATRFTMEEPFYRAYLRVEHGVDTLVPETTDRQEIHRMIYEELCQGVIQETSRQRALAVIERSGADSVIFGCTEIVLLLGASPLKVPTFDTTALHVKAGLDFSLSA